MSISYLAMALRTKLPTAQKLVLLCLAEACDDWGYTSPGHKYLAQKTGMTPRTIIRTIHELEKRGLIVPKKRPGFVTTYQIRGLESAIPEITKDSELAKAENNLSSSDTDLSSSDNLSLVTEFHHPSPPLSPPNGSPPDPLSFTPPISPPTQSINAQARGKKNFYSDEFEAFWKIYPRGIGKAAAYAEWKRLDPDPELQKEILEHLKERVKRDPDWKKEDGKYIVHAERFLKKRRWEDNWKRGPASEGGKDNGSQYYHPGDLRPWEK